MIALTQITNTEIFAFIAVLDFKQGSNYLTRLALKTNIFAFGSFVTDESRIYSFEKNWL